MAKHKKESHHKESEKHHKEHHKEHHKKDGHGDMAKKAKVGKK